MTEVLAELNGVDLNEVEVETEDGGDEEDNDVAGEDCEEGVAANGVLVDVIGPFALEKKERAEDKREDEKRDDSDADEAPEIEQALVKERAEAGGGVGLVDEESSGDKEKVDEEIEGDRRVSEACACV